MDDYPFFRAEHWTGYRKGKQVQNRYCDWASYLEYQGVGQLITSLKVLRIQNDWIIMFQHLNSNRHIFKFKLIWGKGEQTLDLITKLYKCGFNNQRYSGCRFCQKIHGGNRVDSNLVTPIIVEPDKLFFNPRTSQKCNYLFSSM